MAWHGHALLLSPAVLCMLAMDANEQNSIPPEGRKEAHVQLNQLTGGDQAAKLGVVKLAARRTRSDCCTWQWHHPLIDSLAHDEALMMIDFAILM